MSNIYNIRAKKVFSGKNVRVYPTSVPFDERYKVYIENIKRGCTKKNSTINVLELGCGTGRYFSYLTNINKLTGVDISKEMLEVASRNIALMPELINKTELIHSSIEEFNTTEKYDFIYSIGTLGEYCEFNKDLLEKIVSMLKPDGILCFTIVDSESYINNEYIWPRKKFYRFISRFLPNKWGSHLEKHTLITNDWKPLFLSTSEVKKILNSTKKKIGWELTRTKDNFHVHHFCRVWLAKFLIAISAAIENIIGYELLYLEECLVMI
ncbi:MAG TPA: class I SAM-dependent methyltransferase [Chitinophagaceae bacterium]|nr:class I SAM-dependent methyltransferase [Chitinophagaceae bacterium]